VGRKNDVFNQRFKGVIGLVKKKHPGMTNIKVEEALGLSDQQLSSYMYRGAHPHLMVFRKLCIKLGVSADYLLGLSDYKSIRR
jgi:transcriptional regulator with XRE-family HTH domain